MQNLRPREFRFLTTQQSLISTGWETRELTDESFHAAPTRPVSLLCGAADPHSVQHKSHTQLPCQAPQTKMLTFHVPDQCRTIIVAMQCNEQGSKACSILQASPSSLGTQLTEGMRHPAFLISPARIAIRFTESTSDDQKTSPV